MPLGKVRDRVFHGLARARGRMHRYSRVRIAVGVAFTLAVAALPLCGLLRFDLWGGRHVWLGEELDLATVAKRFAFPFLAVNIAILLVTRFLGRWLCGFVCPWGALSRLAEWARVGGARVGRRRAVGVALVGAISLALALIVVAFWIDLRVFARGSALAIGLASAFLAGTWASIGLGTWLVGLRFCRDWCPSGVYFAVLAPEAGTGVVFDPEACIDCRACDQSCPIDLAPRRVGEEIPREGRGFYPDALPSTALCIRCGDCVASCEQVAAKRGKRVALALSATRPASADRPPRALDADPADGDARAGGAGSPEPEARSVERRQEERRAG